VSTDRGGSPGGGHTARWRRRPPSRCHCWGSYSASCLQEEEQDGAGMMTPVMTLVIPGFSIKSPGSYADLPSANGSKRASAPLSPASQPGSQAHSHEWREDNNSVVCSENLFFNKGYSCVYRRNKTKKVYLCDNEWIMQTLYVLSPFHPPARGQAVHYSCFLTKHPQKLTTFPASSADLFFFGRLIQYISYSKSGSFVISNLSSWRTARRPRVSCPRSRSSRTAPCPAWASRLLVPFLFRTSE